MNNIQKDNNLTSNSSHDKSKTITRNDPTVEGIIGLMQLRNSRPLDDDVQPCATGTMSSSYETRPPPVLDTSLNTTNTIAMSGKSADHKRKIEPASSSGAADGVTKKKRKIAKIPQWWSMEEDGMLRMAVGKNQGKNWKQIAEKVPGRNHTQCLQRWNMVLQPGLVKGNWTGAEDATLRRLMKNEVGVEHGTRNWKEVANHISGRTSRQCRERWFHQLDPLINRGAFTVEEDNILNEMQNRLGNRWSTIAQSLPGRTEDSVKLRWKALGQEIPVKPVKQQFVIEPRCFVRKSAKKVPKKSTAHISNSCFSPSLVNIEMTLTSVGNDIIEQASSSTEGKTQEQTSTSSTEALNTRKMTKWSIHDDKSLRVAVENNKGRNWKAIAEKVPGRNHTQCLQRWTKALQPGLVKGLWTLVEDFQLRSFVVTGSGNWKQVSSKITGRTSKQCRERWFHHLDPTINKGTFTAAEDEIVIEQQAKLGNRWAAIAQCLPGRTENSVKMRCKALARDGSRSSSNSSISSTN